MPKVTGPLDTTASTDVYPTHDSVLQLGGFREVADTTARNAITTARRRAGMLVYTIADDKYWRLKTGPWAGTDADWIRASMPNGITDSNGVQWAVTVDTDGSLITTIVAAFNSSFFSYGTLGLGFF